MAQNGGAAPKCDGNQYCNGKWPGKDVNGIWSRPETREDWLRQMKVPGLGVLQDPPSPRTGRSIGKAIIYRCIGHEPQEKCPKERERTPQEERRKPDQLVGRKFCHDT
jgi:hypothetical protein